MAARHPVPRKTSTSLLSDRWDLTHLVKDPLKNLKRHLTALDAQVVQIESARPRLQAAMAALISTAPEARRSIAKVLRSAFAYLWFPAPKTPKLGKVVESGHRQ